RTDPDAPRKYDGLSFFLAPMTVPGVETVPIKKLTGEYGFTQTFFTDARIPATSLIGGEGKGWAVAMRTLEYERGARGGQAGGYVTVYPDVGEVVELAKRALRNGHPACEDPIIRDKLVKLLATYRGLQLNGKRSRIAPLVQDKPMSLPLMSKLIATEFYREINQLAMAMQGPRGAYYVGEPEAYDEGIWQRSYLNAFSGTIGGGTSQIQHNIIGEHVLGLPKS
ncbi:MAG: acyl-CoA dehydrogenase family protein, partial [Nitratireductor sp.]